MKPRISDRHLKWLLEHIIPNGGDTVPLMEDLRDLRAKVREVLEIHCKTLGCSGPLLDLIDMVKEAKP